jgi:peroxiredoxin
MMIAEFQKKKNSMADHISISGDSESKHKKIKKENEINRKKR